MPKPRIERVTVNCAACDKEVEREKRQVEKNSTGRFFCSASCRALIGSKPRLRPDSICEVCGVSYQPQSYNRVSRFCSKPCMDEWQSRNRQTQRCPECGKEFTLAPSQKARGITHCSRACVALSQTKHGVGRFHNGKHVREADGYLYVWEPEHPNAHSSGWIAEHRLVAATTLDRPLTDEEQVHHINGNAHDNGPDNLLVLSASAHTAITLSESGVKRAAAQARIRELEAQVAEYQEKFGPLD